jgi:MoaA/NifB/PqqE/SkfB family radical SAM enzyme
MAEGGRLVVVCKVTQACNLGCAFCGYDRALPWPRGTAAPERLAQLGQTLASLQRETGRPVLVSWLGGEPLLWQPLTALALQFRALGLALSVTTNGTTLGSPAVRAHLCDEYAEVTVSVDGLGDVHDRLRAWPGGFAFLRRHVTALAAGRRDRRPLLRANLVLMRDNVPDLRALCLELASWGFDELTWNQLGGNDRPAFYPAHRLRPEDVAAVRALLPGLRAELAARGVRLGGGERYLERFAATSAGRALPVADCGAGERFLFVGLDGTIAPCSFTARELGVPLAALAAPERALGARFRDARLRARPAACDDCHSTQVFGKFMESP